ncbi:hypothetical protein [Rothia nasimurium]|uniref:hypothetical protein n=1 Tax=Rothia nasimurium TaxID=85336 RepID=UPI00162704A4|nr:hypothetical protein [Rothia nasimurium]
MPWRRLSALVAVGALMVGCSSGPRAVSAEKQAAIEDEFWAVLPQVVEDTGLDPSSFKYASGRTYDPQKVADRSFTPQGVCDSSGEETLYRIELAMDTFDVDDVQHPASEYTARSERMRALWESRGFEVKNAGPYGNGYEIVYVTEQGITVSYYVGDKGESIVLRSECVLSEDG